MKKCFFVILLLSLASVCVSQSKATYSTYKNGDWANSTTWVAGNIAPISGNNASDWIGHVVVLNNSISFDNGCELHVNGNLIINGNLTANNNLLIDVTGTLVINGNVIGKNNAGIKISGAATVTGNVGFEGNGSIAMNNGTLTIGGSLTGGTGGEITGTGTINIDGGNTFDPTPAGGVDVNPALPVEFIGLSYKVNSDNVELKWETASEIFNDYFTIEKSQNGTDFEVIGNVKGSGYSNSIVKYNFFDENIENGVCYYRLSQTDYDGTTVILKTIVCKITADKNAVIAFQNPVVEETFQVNYSGEPGKYILNIYNVNGQVVLTEENTSENNSGTFNVNRSGIKGYYFISVTNSLGKTSSSPVIFN